MSATILNSATNVSPKSTKKKFLNSVNYFRGIAIILIVLGHSYELAGWDLPHSWQEVGLAAQLFYSASVNGSVYFIFISGFLYYHIFYKRFNYGKFMNKKLQYVLLPYLLISIVPIAYKVLSGDVDSYTPAVVGDQPLALASWYLFGGRLNYAYWYIPMAMLLFAISPIINIVIKYKKSLFVALLLLPISLIVHRSVANINHIQSLIYFLPVYFLGIWSSRHHQQILHYLKSNRSKLALAAIALGFGLIQVVLFNYAGNSHKEFWAVTVPDVNLLQKIALCFLFLAVLDLWENKELPIIKKTAETSFAIYFLHPFVGNLLYKITSDLNISYQGNLFTLLLATVVMVVTSMGIAMGIKGVLGKKSRYLIGW